jgi:hypothetical protein
MFNLNNAPVTAVELSAFAKLVVNELATRAFSPDDTELLLAADDGADAVLLFHADDEADPAAVQAQADQLFASPRRMAAMVTTIGWAPTEADPIALSWLIVAVGVGGQLPAFAACRRVAGDRGWTVIPHTHLPWLALSTAASLRAALESGEPLKLKSTADHRLARRPDEEPDPPVDEQGRL